MGQSPAWTYGYVPTAAEWTYQFASKQDELNLSTLTVQTLQFGVGSPNGIASLNSSGHLNASQFPASLNLTGDVTTAGSVATVVAVGGKTISLANSFTTSGNFAVSVTATGTTNITLPTSGTLMTNPMTTSGDVIYGGASGVPTRLAVGTNGFVLTLTAGVPTWANPSAGGNVSNVATPTNGQMAQWTGATTIQGIATTGSGNAVLATAPTLSNPVVGTQAAGDSSTKAASTAFVQNAWTTTDPGGFINQFRNASFDVAQRGSSGTVTTGNTSYTLDGWQIAPTGATASWSQQYNQNLAGNALRIACATGMTACNLQQRIESFIAANLLTYAKGLQAVTVQFAIYNGTTGSITPQIAAGYASAQDNFGTVTSDLAATNLQSISSSTAAIVAYTFTPGSVNLANGYQIKLLFGGGLNAASGFVDIGFADIRVTAGVSTGLNSTPPPAEIRTTASETLFCQRYYWQTLANFSPAANAAGASNTFPFLLRFPTPMRATPTVGNSFSGASNCSTAIQGTNAQDTQIALTSSAAGILFATYNSGNAITAEL